MYDFSIVPFEYYEKEHNQLLLESTIRDLVCAYCRHASFGYDTVMKPFVQSVEPYQDSDVDTMSIWRFLLRY